MHEHWPLAERYSSLWVGGSAQQIEMFGFMMCRLIYYLVFSSTLTFHCGCFHFRFFRHSSELALATTRHDSLMVPSAPARNLVISFCCHQCLQTVILAGAGATWSENTHSEMLVLRKKPNSILVYTSWSQTLLFAEHCRRPRMVHWNIAIMWNIGILEYWEHGILVTWYSFEGCQWKWNGLPPKQVTPGTSSNLQRNSLLSWNGLPSARLIVLESVYF